MLVLGVVVVLLSSAAPDPGARAILDTAIARMGGLAALTAVDRMRLEVMTEWQRVDFAADHPPVILSYELSTELRDYTTPAWRYSRRFFSPNGTSGVVDLVSDSVAAVELNGQWRPQNVAYVDERDEVFTFAPERVLALAHAAADARALPDTVVRLVRRRYRSSEPSPFCAAPLRWAYAVAAGPVQMAYITDRARQRGWRVDRIGSVRNFVGTPASATSAANR